MRSKEKANIKLSDFPEEVTKDGVRIFGETSYENHLAVLSHSNHDRYHGEEQFQFPEQYESDYATSEIIDPKYKLAT